MNPDVPSIPNYEILGRLGQGGMGTVYLARDQRLDRQVALKLLSPWLASDESARRRFLLEARAAAALDHPAICTVYEVGETPEGQVYIAMAYCEGNTLQQRLVSGPISIGEAVGFAALIAHGLAKAHGKGIVHRDIKPANVICSSTGDLKILDFGIAKVTGIELTRTGGVIGTVSYMSPEQTRAEPVDFRTDIWSLGVVLYEMLTGRRPFDARNEMALIMAIGAAEPPAASAWRGDLPVAVDHLVRRMLSKRVEDRPESTSTLAEELSALAALLRAEPPPVDRGAAVALEGERRSVAVVVALLDGYDRLIERLAPEEAEPVLSRIRSVALDVAGRYDGYIDRVDGSELVSFFGLASSREDDALRAVEAARELVARVPEAATGLEQKLGGPIGVRASVHVGIVAVHRSRSSERKWRVTGALVAAAARSAAEVERGSIRVSPECQRLVAPFARSAFAPFVGRLAELGTVRGLLDSVRRGEGKIVTIIGDVGIGKSRLLSELRGRLVSDGVQALTGRCDPKAAPYRPLIGLLSDAIGLAGHEAAMVRPADVAARVAALDPSLEESLPFYLHLLGIGSAEHPIPPHLQGEHLQSAFKNALVALVTAGASTATPRALLVEDLHWADQASRAVLRELAEITPAYPILLVVSSRPDGAMDLGASRPIGILLDPLDRAAVEALLRGILKADQVEAALVDWLFERTAGNPFFLEEACQSLVERGVVDVLDGTARIGGSDQSLHLPETVEAVIRARIDRLEPDTRELLRVASVVGPDFGRGLLERMLGQVGALSPSLERLKGTGLVQQTRVAPEPAYRFKHALTREVAYDSLLAHQRRSLHGAAGRAVEEVYRERLDEHLDQLAHHFGQAEEWDLAARYGLQAARRADQWAQFAEALELLDRVRTWLERLPDDSERRDRLADVVLLQERMCETLGLRTRQQSLIDEAIGLLHDAGTSPRLVEAHVRQGDLHTLLGQFAPGAAVLETALRLSREQGDAAGEQKALRSLGMLRWHQGRNEEALRHVEEAVRIARERNDLEALVGDLHNLGPILKGLKEYQRAIACLEEALDLSARLLDPINEVYAAISLANVHHDLGNLEVADGLLRRADDLLVARRLPILQSLVRMKRANAAMEQNQPVESLRLYHEAAGLSRKARHAEGLAQALRMGGEVLIGIARSAEAIPLLEEGERLFAQLQDPSGQLETLEGLIRAGRQTGAPGTDAWCRETLVLTPIDDAPRQARLQNILGILAWERGAFADALGCYQAALGEIRRTDQRADEGVILNSLGATLIRLGRFQEAGRVFEESVTLTAASGQPLLQAHALAGLGDVCAATGRADQARGFLDEARAIRSALRHDEAAERLALRIRQLTEVPPGDDERGE